MPSLRQVKHSAEPAHNSMSLASTIKRVRAITEDETLPNVELIREYLAEARQALAPKWAIEDEETRNELEEMLILYAAKEYMKNDAEGF